MTSWVFLVGGGLQTSPYGGHNVWICAAPAQISTHTLSDFLITQLRRLNGLAHVRRHVAGDAGTCFIKKTDGRHDLSGRAKAALKRIAFEKCRLKRVQRAVRRQ